MENLLRLEYCPELNQERFLGRKTLKILNDNPDISDIIDEYIEEVEAKDDSGVILCYCFSNKDKQKSRYGTSYYSVLVFPKYGEIDYTLKKGDFWVNQGTDPITTNGSRRYTGFFEDLGFKQPLFNYLFLFRKNPFDNMEQYLSHMGPYDITLRNSVFDL